MMVSPATLEPVLAALDVEPFGSGVQLADGAAIASRYSPHLDVDRPALIALNGADLALLARSLRNAYPAAHPATLVSLADGGVALRPTTLTEMVEVSAPAAYLYVPALPHPGSVLSLDGVMATLLSPTGCPWDREQTHLSLRPYLLEETYECLDALDAGDLDKLSEELGDLLLQVVFHAQIATRDGEFQLSDVAGHITSKLIRRHPHVFGDVEVADAEGVTRNWERLKAAERAKKGERAANPFAGIVLALPALSRAQEIQRRAARYGFAWPSREGAWAKLQEEFAEWQAAQTAEERAAEFGDMLFALANVALWDNVDGESALREANNRFTRRFSDILAALEAAGADPHALTADEWLARWG
ncbi:MAG: nucleoside triphosphate pyrophosphohydrolase [Anaerolineae bacterium]